MRRGLGNVGKQVCTASEVINPHLIVRWVNDAVVIPIRSKIGRRTKVVAPYRKVRRIYGAIHVVVAKQNGQRDARLKPSFGQRYNE